MTPTQRDRMKRNSNGENNSRNVCTSAVVAAFCGTDHLSGRYLHTTSDVRRALRSAGYSVRSVKTLLTSNLRTASGLKVQQVERAMQDREGRTSWVTSSARQGERLVGLVYHTKGHIAAACELIDGGTQVVDTARRPGAQVLNVWAVYDSA